MNVWVNIGAKVGATLNSATSRVEQRFSQMSRRLKVIAAETKVAYKEAAAAIKPVAALAAAGGVTLGVKKAIGSGANLMHEVSLLRISGRTAGETALAIKQAHRTVAEVPTSTMVENLKILRETVGAYGDLKHAMENLSFNQRLGFSMTNVMGMDQSEAMHTLVAGIQALEIRGSAMDHTRYQREMNALFQSSAFFAGKEGAFTAASLRDFAKTGNIPLKLMNERFMTRILPAMITEVGSGDIVGTQMTAFNNWLNGNTGTGNKSKTEYAKKIGLVDATIASNFTKTGWKPGAVVGTNLAKEDAFKWVETVLLPKLEKAGVNIKDTKALEIGLSRLMTKETAKRFLMGLADPLQRKRLHKDEENVNKAMSSEEGYKFMLANDPTAAWAKIMSKLDNLATRLGQHIFTDRFFAATDKFSAAIDRVSGFFERSPKAANATLLGMGAASFGLIATILGGGGLLKLIGGGVGRLFAGFTSIVGGAFMAAFKGAGPYVMAGLRGLASFFTAGFRALGPFVGAGLRAIGPFLMAGLRAIAPMVASGLRAIGPWLMSGLRMIGPVATAGLRLLGPWLLGGLRIALGILSGPVGWVLLAASALALAYAYRDKIAAAWHAVTAWFTATAWPAVAATVSAIGNWGATIVDRIIGGLSANWGRLKSWFAGKWNGLVPAFMQVGAPPAQGPAVGRGGTGRPPVQGPVANAGRVIRPAPQMAGRGVRPAAPTMKLAGARANGGSWSSSKPYLVGEEGPEIAVPGRSGTIIPAHVLAAMGRGGGSGGNMTVGDIHIHESRDARATAREVKAELKRMARRQDALLTD